MMYRWPFALAGTLLIFLGAEARASYLYNWSTMSGSAVDLYSDSGTYKMTVSNEPERGPLNHSTDTTASRLSIFKMPDMPTGTDTFHGAFDLKLVITDQANGLKNDGLGGNPAPLMYHVTFTTTVNSDGSTSTSAVALNPTSNTLTLGLDSFVAHLPSTGQWFVAPPTVGSINSGSVGLSIDFTDGSGGGNEPPPAPEPSSLILGTMGVLCASMSTWRKKKRRTPASL